MPQASTRHNRVDNAGMNEKAIIDEMIKQKKAIEAMEQQKNANNSRLFALKSAFDLFVIKNFHVVAGFKPHENSSTRLSELRNSWQNGDKEPFRIKVKYEQIDNAKQNIKEYLAFVNNKDPDEIEQEEVEKYYQKHAKEKGDGTVDVEYCFQSYQQWYEYDVLRAQQGKLTACYNSYTHKLVYRCGEDGKLYGPDDEEFVFPGEAEFSKLLAPEKNTDKLTADEGSTLEIIYEENPALSNATVLDSECDSLDSSEELTATNMRM